jgi:hypothetical protein
MLLPIEGKQTARDPSRKAKPSRSIRVVEDAADRPLGKRRSTR